MPGALENENPGTLFMSAYSFGSWLEEVKKILGTHRLIRSG